MKLITVFGRVQGLKYEFFEMKSLEILSAGSFGGLFMIVSKEISNAN